MIRTLEEVVPRVLAVKICSYLPYDHFFTTINEIDEYIYSDRIDNYGCKVPKHAFQDMIHHWRLSHVYPGVRLNAASRLGVPFEDYDDIVHTMLPTGHEQCKRFIIGTLRDDEEEITDGERNFFEQHFANELYPFAIMRIIQSTTLVHAYRSGAGVVLCHLISLLKPVFPELHEFGVACLRRDSKFINVRKMQDEFNRLFLEGA